MNHASQRDDASVEELDLQIELKCAVAPEGADAALQDLGRPKRERTIYFFDTRRLALFRKGLILRARQSGKDDVTVKIRNDQARQLWRHYERAPKEDAKLEGDQSLGCLPVDAFSITSEPPPTPIQEVLDANEAVESLFSPAAIATMANVTAIPWSEIVPLGPIAAQIWDLALDGVDGETRCEVWTIGRTRFVEFSQKGRRETIALASKQLTAFFERKRWPLLDHDQSKTGRALHCLTE